MVHANENLKEDIEVKTQLPFQVSRTGNSWLTSTNIRKNELPKQLYIRFNPTSWGDFSGELIFASEGVLTIVELRGDAPNAIDVPSFESGISLFPNPASTEVTIKTNNLLLNTQNTQVVCTIYNTLGEKIHDFIISDNETIINTTDYSPGVYFVRFLSENKSAVIKLIISIS